MKSIKNWDNKTWLSSKDYINSFNKFLIKHSNLNSNSKILDIGCNDASISKILKRNKNCQVTAIDKDKNSFSKNEIDEYISFDLDNGLPDINYNNFDYVLMIDVIEHLKNPEEFMSKFKTIEFKSLFVSVETFTSEK